MDRVRCGLLVEARNAPWYFPEEYSGDLPGYELTCVVTRLENVVSRV